MTGWEAELPVTHQLRAILGRVTPTALRGGTGSPGTVSTAPPKHLRWQSPGRSGNRAQVSLQNPETGNCGFDPRVCTPDALCFDQALLIPSMKVVPELSPPSSSLSAGRVGVLLQGASASMDRVFFFFF